MRTVLLIATLFSVASPWLAHAQQTDIIRGRVTGAPPDTGGIQGVNVKAISYVGGVTRATTTDRSGRYQIIVANGEGDYWVEFTKIGFAPKRFEIKRIGSEEVLIANTRMSSTIVALDSVTVTAVGSQFRALVNRRSTDPDVSGNATSLIGADVAADQLGNLAALAGGIAGIQLIPGLDGQADMFSVLGLSGDQNSTVFNGIGSGITLLPPEIIAKAALSSVSFDPSVGGFSGGQISVSTLPGSNVSRRAIAHTNILPAFQWTDATAAAQAQKFTSVRIGGNAAGPLVTDRAFYNIAYNVSQRLSDARTLLNTGALGLTGAGVALDSVARLSDILTDQGVPLVGGISRTQKQSIAVASANFDISPSRSGAGDSFIVGVLGNYQRSDPVNQGLLATPLHAGSSSGWSATAGLTHTRYIRFLLSKTTLGAAASLTSSSPHLDLPEGTVRVRSALSDGSTTVKSLVFGGSPTRSEAQTSTVQGRNELSWFSGNNRHTLKVTSSVTHSSFSTDDGSGLLGRFTFNSLEDLQAGRAASFNRTLSHRTRSAGQLALSASLGDYWRPGPAFQLQYGARVDAARFLSAPAFNPAVLAAFGARNDHVPSDVTVSPRFGLQWSYGKSATVAAFPGAARPPRAIVHAGIGVFQNVAGPQLIGSAISATGLPSATQTLVCVGDAVPFADWSGFLTSQDLIPSQCADGSLGTAFSTTAPSVSLFDSRFRQPRSLRAAADWGGAILDNRFQLGVQTIWSWGRDQRGQVDVNLNATPRFTLGNEDARPVFVGPSAIVTATGAMAPRESRVSPDFQRVWMERSGLRTNSRLLSISLVPVMAPRWFKWMGSYALLDVDETFYGFSATAGNPFEIGRGPSLRSPRHRLSFLWRSIPVFDVAYVTTSVQMTSGGRYTPRIAGDVNGDGLSNDNAYVFDPSTATDTALAGAMRSLLSAGPRSGRACLARQLGTLAARGSCQAPWTTSASLSVQFNPARIGLPKRATVSLNIQQPLVLADLLLHGRNDTHGWGQAIAPDPTLLFVRGFDPVTNQFRYDVNHRFGSTRPQQATARRLPHLSISVNLDIGVPRERQTLIQRLDMGRVRSGAMMDDRAVWQLGVASIPNPMMLVLQQADSLGLTRQQADSLAWLSQRFVIYGDSIWTGVSRALAKLPTSYDRDEAYGQFVQAREKTVDYLLTVVGNVKGLLSASQRRKLPLQITNLLDERVLRFLRSSSSGDISGVAR